MVVLIMVCVIHRKDTRKRVLELNTSKAGNSIPKDESSFVLFQIHHKAPFTPLMTVLLYILKMMCPASILINLSYIKFQGRHWCCESH